MTRPAYNDSPAAMARTGRASADDYTNLVGSPQYGGASGKLTLKDEDGGRRGERERERERERETRERGESERGEREGKRKRDERGERERE